MSNLEQQRKRAKDLRKAARRGEVNAGERIACHLPRARGRSPAELVAGAFTLAEAQLVVAREAGFASWPAMRRALAAPTATDALIEAALRGDAEAVARGASESLHAAAAIADLDGVRAWLADAGGEAAAGGAAAGVTDQRGGPRDWTPLLYACCARAPRDAAARLAIARELLERGADPDALGHVPGLATANVTVFDDCEWRPLEGAAERVASVELVGLLLDRGADPQQTTALLTRAVAGGDLDVLRRLLAADPPWWQVTWALCACSELDRRDHARLLVAHAASPKTIEPALLDTIRLHRAHELVEILVGTPADPTHGCWRQAYRTAIRHGNTRAAAALASSGVTAPLSAIDRAIAACVTGAEPPRLDGNEQLSAADHTMVSWAIRSGRHAAAARLLALGLDPDVADSDGKTPLHLAVGGAAPGVIGHEPGMRQSPGPVVVVGPDAAIATITTLLAAGARMRRDYDARTPLDLALAIRDPAIREPVRAALLAGGATPDLDEAVEHGDADVLFERAADAVAFGDLDTLRELLDDEPGLVHARSPRLHRATLLHYCAANGTEDPRQRTPANAPAIAQLLLDHGADPDATCKLYGGPAQTIGLLLTSAIPRAAGLDGELVRVLARGGATLTARDLAGAILYGMPLAVAALVEAGVPVDSLVAAAGCDRVDVLAELIAGGADVNARGESGATALHAAAVMNAEAAARWLLAHGADPALREYDWDATPASFARHFEHHALAELLDR